jgi:hypothetical protein
MNASSWIIRQLGLLPLAVACSAVAFAAEDDRRMPVPGAAELKSAENLVREIFAKEYTAAKTDEVKSKLAKEILAGAMGSAEAPTEQYVLLRVARDIAAGAGDAETALHAVGEIGRRFRVDLLGMQAKVLEKAVEEARLPSEHVALLPAVRSVLEEAIAAERFELAGQLGQLASSSALKSRDINARKEVTARLAQLDDLRKGFAAAKQALEVLAGNPTDPEANLAVGKYRCFLKGDWENGLPMLALGSDASLSQLAKKELLKPADSDAQVALADAWWEVATQEDDPAGGPLQQRAAYWYRKALPGLTGLAKAKAEQRIATRVPGGRAGVDFRRGAVLFLTFDKDSFVQQGSGNHVRDLSGQNNHGKVRGATPATGVVGEALSFNGKNAYVEFPSLRASLTDNLTSLLISRARPIPPLIPDSYFAAVRSRSLRRPYFLILL